MAELDGKMYIVRRTDLKVQKFDVGTQLNLPAGQIQNVNIYAPAGMVCYSRVINIKAPKIAGATSGKHTVNVRSGGSILVSGTSKFDSDVHFIYGYFYTATDSVFPLDPIAQILMTQELVFTETEPLLFEYRNNTDALANGLFDVEIVARGQMI